MISYKEWKQFQNLQENFGFTLGLGVQQTLGVMGSNTKTSEEMLEEAKKKAKKMLAGSGDKPEMDDADDDESGDGEMVEPASPKDDPKGDVEGDVEGEGEGEGEGENLNKPMFSKKKSKKESVEAADADEQAFFDDLRSMLKISDRVANAGIKAVAEDYLLPQMNFSMGVPDAVLTPVEEPEVSIQPQDGYVGSAPEGRLGFFGGYAMDEWCGVNKGPVKKK